MAQGSDLASNRRWRVDQLRKFVQNNSGIQKSAAIGVMIRRTGVSARKIQEYIKELVLMGDITDEGGVLKAVSKE